MQAQETSELSDLVAELSANIDRLKSKWEQANNHAIPTPYLQTLSFDSDLLEEAAHEPDFERRLGLLTYVKDDLNLKSRQADRTVGAAGGLGASIRVTVRTTKNGDGVNGYLVRCNPKRFADLQRPMFVFNNETNPTTVMKLAPGNYEMWVEKPSGTRVASKPVTIGGEGGTSQAVNFEVP